MNPFFQMLHSAQSTAAAEAGLWIGSSRRAKALLHPVAGYGDAKNDWAEAGSDLRRFANTRSLRAARPPV